MALGTFAKPVFETPSGGAGVVYPGSAKSGWFVLHDDISTGVAAQTSTELRTIFSVSNTSVHPAKVVDGATRLVLRAKYPAAVRIAATMPVIQLYGIYDAPTIAAGTNVPAWANDGTADFMRLDASTIAAAGQTITLTATDSANSTYQYTDPISLTATDFQCAKYIMALVQTAGIITTGSGAIQLVGMFQN